MQHRSAQPRFARGMCVALVAAIALLATQRSRAERLRFRLVLISKAAQSCSTFGGTASVPPYDL